LKLKEAIQGLGADNAIFLAQQAAEKIGIDWHEGACFIFHVVANDPSRAPGNIGGNNDGAEAVIEKWLRRYQAGKEGRASLRISNPPGTIADPIIEEIIGARLTNLTEEELNKVTYAHRLGMSAENILGLMLEEYLALNLQAYGWYCAWGETVRSVDFVNENGDLLQIKNRSNSENSSSSAIRQGTGIKKWYRIKADRVEYMWPALNKICNTTHLSEENFIEFVHTIINNNPSCLAVEANNPWKA